MSNEEKLLSKQNEKGYKVGDTFEKRMDSSSPPATWTEEYKVTRVDGTGVYGIYQDTPYFEEYDGEDMR